ncbi:MAG: 30S ribosomal protein S13 [Candidatus Woesearchaeota archaeon]
MEQKLKPIIRIRTTDVNGNKSIMNALLKVKGVSHSMSNMLCNVLKLDKTKKIGYLTDEEVKKIEESIKDPKSINIPTWALNRQKDLETNEDHHVSGTDLRLRKEFDIKRLRKIKSYVGMRHAAGLPVRGQRTKGHFRKGKSLGVKKKKVGKKA